MNTDDDTMVDVLVGYLVTHPDGYQARMDDDKTRVNLYAQRNHAQIEPMYVKRLRSIVEALPPDA